MRLVNLHVKKPKRIIRARITLTSADGRQCEVELPDGSFGSLREDNRLYARAYYVYRRTGRIGVDVDVLVRKLGKKKQPGYWSCELVAGATNHKVGDAETINAVTLHWLRDKDSESGAYAIYGEGTDGSLYRVTPVPFFAPERLIDQRSRLDVAIDGPREKGVYPAHFRKLPRDVAKGGNRVPRPGDLVPCRVERVTRKGIKCLVCNGRYGYLEFGAESQLNEPPVGHFRRRDIIRLIVQSASEAEKPFRLALPLSGTTVMQGSTVQESQDPFDENDPKLTSREVFDRSNKFRDLVMKEYGGVCVICGEDWTIASEFFAEAAHVIPKHKRGADNIDNAVCLCPIHHWAFDRGLIGIDPQNLIRLADVLLAEKKLPPRFRELHGTDARFPKGHRLPRTALNWHWERVFLGKPDAV